MTNAIGEIEGIKLIKVKRAGSWKKGTALAPRGEYALDIDMVFFVEKEDGYEFDAEDIRSDLIDILCAAYPNKRREDFNNGKKTVGVVFKERGWKLTSFRLSPRRREVRMDCSQKRH